MKDNHIAVPVCGAASEELSFLEYPALGFPANEKRQVLPWSCLLWAALTLSSTGLGWLRSTGN